MQNFYPEKEFKSFFKKKIQFAYFCPGRINLIGEHIDYNGGIVMPCAIDMGTYLFFAFNTEQVVRLRSLNFPDSMDIKLEDSFHKRGNEWFNYPLGVLNFFLEDNFKLEGMDILFYGNLPISSGLSSSASIEMVTAFALNEIFNGNYSLLDLVQLTKLVENKFIGVNSGIMDQFAVAFGKESSAIVLNCTTMDYTIVPVELENYKLVIIDTNKARTLADSKYNSRVRECQQALALLKKKLPIKELCDINAQELYSHKNLISDPIIWNRARHVIEENDRVKKASQYLSDKRLMDFGELLFQSHESLRYLYEVSGRELDLIVDFCSEFSGVLGARMTGAGFGGCAIALVHENWAEKFSADLIVKYHSCMGYPPTLYTSKIGNGVKKFLLQ